MKNKPKQLSLLTSHQKYTALLPQTQLEKMSSLKIILKLSSGSRLTSVDTASNRGLSLDVTSKISSFVTTKTGGKCCDVPLMPV